jgi:hypothetical protein
VSRQVKAVVLQPGTTSQPPTMPVQGRQALLSGPFKQLLLRLCMLLV